ncbi:MAG: 2OG-Fe(II) oxygenase [Planctomycetota bacterium]|nr:2OG-Fe(II) oxygenase [Planctomycetota bacterium]
MYKKISAAFSEDYIQSAERRFLESPYLGKSPLGAEFIKTKGFSIVFRRSSLSRVMEQFQFLRVFLEEVVFKSCNAFYVNPLLLSDDSRVDAHVDCRLLPAEDLRIVPNLVSILYVKADPEMIGGELVLNVGHEDELTLKLQSNDLIHFVGDLVHKVTPVQGGVNRICFVCEQYNLPAEALDAFPEYALLRDKDLAPRVSL